jgi:DNA adenine methylase Dam
VPKKAKPAARLYKIRRKIPNPSYSLDEIIRPHVPKSPRRSRVRDEQLAIAAVETAAPTEAQPFLKWVGGKAQLLAQFDEFLPVQIDRYVELFIGGGAVFFHLKHRFPQMRAFLRDNNDELINTYKAVRDFPRELMRRLDRHLTVFKSDRENHYYLVRARHHLPPDEIVDRAARMIFLNKTCFNGLWRVNSRGEFNVPIGSHKIQNHYIYETNQTGKIL